MTDVADPITGEWCPECLLPSATTFPQGLKAYAPDGRVIGTIAVTICEDCGWSVVHVGRGPRPQPTTTQEQGAHHHR